MKIRNLFLGIIASLATLVACQEEEVNLGTPNIVLSETEIAFEAIGGDYSLTVTASRDWMVETDAEWVVVSPESGLASADEQTITVTALENTGLDRTVDIKFTIGMKSKYLTVNQAGPGGSAEDLIVYSNDFDKEKAEKGDSWTTYLDSFEGWKNETGTGISDVTYAFDRITARTNSGNGSAGTYSDYAGSGMNYLWFGSGAPYFAVKNITLPKGNADFTLSFGAERYEYNAADNTFNFNEFEVYVSADAKKWVKLSCDFAAGVMPNGRWDLASSTFTVPAGTSSLSVYFASSIGSSYALDDVKLEIAASAGTAIDFASGEEFEIGDNTSGGNNDNGGSTTAPESKGKKTVEEFIAAADKSNYYELTGKVSGFNATYCSFDLTDDSGKIYVYSVLDASKAEWTDKIANGGTITIYGKYEYYEPKTQHEVVDAYIVSYTAGDSGSSDDSDDAEGKPTNLVKATVAEFLAAEESSDTWYELTGEITSIVTGNAYGNLYINDGTGEVYIYGLTNGWVGYNNKSFDSIGLNVGDTVTLGTLRGSYKGEPQGGGSKMPAFYISHVAGEGGSSDKGDDEQGGGQGEAGEYDPQNISWTLGSKAYDNTSGDNAQTGTVNGVEVSNMLKLGTSKLTGDATLHVPAGTKKLGLYCVAWKGKTAQLRFSIDGTEIAVIEPSANAGAVGNPPYTITLSDSDYYEIEMPSTDAADVRVETLDAANGRVIIIGLNAIAE